MARDIKTTISLDGASKFNKSLKEIDVELKKLSSEMKMVTSSFDKNNASVEDLRRVNQVLLKQIEQQSIKVNALKGAVAESNTEYLKAQQMLQKATAEYGENSKEADKARQEMEKWQKAINDYTIKLNNAQTYLNNFNSELNKNEKQIADVNSVSSTFGKSLSDNNGDINKSNSKLSDMSSKLSKVSDVLKTVSKVSLKGLKTGIEGVGTALAKISTASLEAVNKTVEVSTEGFNLYTKAITASVAAIATLSTKTGSSFTAQMSTVQALMGYTDYTTEQMDNLAKLEDMAKEIGATTQYTATEVAQGYEKMAMAGWKTQDMLNAMPSFMSATSASGEELSTVFDILTDAMTSFGYEITQSNSEKFADVLSATITNSNTDFEMLGEAFKKVGPIANQLNYSIEDISLGLGLLANNGIKAEMAGTALRSGLLNMANPTEKTQIAMDKLGISLKDSEGNTASFNEVLLNLKQAFGNISSYAFDAEGNLLEYEDIQDKLTGKAEELDALAEAGDIFGKRQTASWLALINSTEADYNKLYTAIQNCDGMAQKMATVKLDNLTGDFTILKSAIEGVGLSIFDYIENPLRTLTQTASNFTSKIRDNIENDLDFSKINVDINLLISEIGNQIKSSTPEINSAIIGISTLINSTIRSTVTNIIDTIPDFIGYGLPVIIDNYWNLINNLIDQITTSAPMLVENGSKVINSFLDGITKTSGNIQKSIPNIVSALSSGIKKVLPNVLNMGKSVLGTIASGMVTALPEVLSIGTELLNYISESLKDAPEKLSSFLDNILRTGLASDLPNLLSSLTGVIDGIIETLSNDDVISNFQTIIKVVGNALVNSLNDILPEIVAFLPTFIDGFIQPMLDLLNNDELFTNLGTAFVDLITIAIDFLAQNTEPLVSAVMQIITAISDALTDNMDTILPAIAEIISGILVGVANNIDALLTSLLDLIGALATTLTSNEVLGPLLDSITTLISKTLFAIIDNLGPITEALTNLFISMVQILADPENLASICDAIAELIGDVFTALPTILAGLGDVLASCYKAFSDWFSSQDWSGIGGDIIRGIADGFEDAFKYASDAISNIGNRLINAFKEKFDINSPSKVMADRIGKFLLPGVAVGMEETVPEVSNDVQKSIDKMVSSVDFNGSIGTMTRNLSDSSIKLAPSNVTALIKANGSDIIPNNATQNIDNSSVKNTNNSYQSLFQGANITVNIHNDDDIQAIAEKLQYYMQRDEMGVGIA